MRALAILALLAGCSEPKSAFVCAGHGSCRDGDRVGVCEESGFCSFEDSECPELRRYGTAAAPALADQCVDLGESPVGDWKLEDAIPVTRKAQGAATDGTSIYVIGGIAGPTPRDDVWVSRVSEGTFGGIEAWVMTTTLPEVRRNTAAAVHEGFLYAIAGRTLANNVASDVLAAPIDAQGMLGAWAASSGLPGGVRCHAVVQSGNQVYVVGGKSDQRTGVADVVIGTMSNGAIEWRPGPKMNSARFCHSAAIAGGYLYAIGGCPFGNNGCPEGLIDDLRGDVEFAKIEADGSLSEFRTTTPLPAERWHHTSAGNGHYLVVAGGHTKTDQSTSTVLVTHVNPDGSLGLWRESTPLLRASSRESALVVGEQIIVVSDTAQVASLRLVPPTP